MDYIQNNNDITIISERNINLNDRKIENINKEITIHATLPNKIIGVKSYSVGEILGKGVNSICYKCINDENLVRNYYACKIFNKGKCENRNEIQRINNEIKIHKSLNNNNIVKLKENFEDKENIYILTEYCRNKTLEELIQKRKKLTEFEVQYYIIQLIKALNYLNNKKIIHRDLQLSNIFLSDNLELKLGDFSYATKYSGNKKQFEICGNPNYMAPEMIDGEDGYSYEVDIWSLGIIIYKLIIGKFPFESKNKEELFNKIKNDQIIFPEDSIISEDAKDLINDILVKVPEDRANLKQIFEHEFFRQLKEIPKSLPTLFLYESPTLSDIKKYIPQIEAKKLIVEKPFTPPKSYALKWVDFSSNCGVGFLFNNGCYVVLFNDKSSIIIGQKEKVFFYKDKNEKDLKKYNLSNYPEELKEKIDSMKIFQKYLNMGKPKFYEKKIRIKDIIYVNDFIIKEEAIFLEYSNKNIHLFLNDNTEIIISKKTNIILYTNDKGEQFAYSLLDTRELFDEKKINIIKPYL